MELSSFNFYMNIDDNSNMQNNFPSRQNISLAKLVKEHKLILLCQWSIYYFFQKANFKYTFSKLSAFYVIFVAL